MKEWIKVTYENSPPRTTNKMTAIESLRIDLNRNRAYVRATREGIKRGVEMKQSTLAHMDIRNHDAAVIKQALRDLRQVKPVYTWMKREDN